MVKVLIIDDSALARKMLRDGLSAYPDIEIVGTASDVYAARDKIVFSKPDVLTLDIEMPKMNGIEFLRRLMPQYPLPVIIVSALSTPDAKVTSDAMELGAVDIVFKPTSSFGIHLSDVIDDLHSKIIAASTVNVSRFKNSKLNIRKVSSYKLEATTDKIIAIGASTGGTLAVQNIMNALPSDLPGTLIVQHMPPGFTSMFAHRLNSSSALDVKEARGDERIHTGQVFIAPGDRHLTVERRGGYYYTCCIPGNRDELHVPSVDVLFSSVAAQAGKNAVGVILTGMGRDGARGLLEMREKGAETIGQDEASSVIYGMPKEAYDCGAVGIQAGIDKIPSEIVEAVKRIIT